MSGSNWSTLNHGGCPSGPHERNDAPSADDVASILDWRENAVWTSETVTDRLVRQEPYDHHHKRNLENEINRINTVLQPTSQKK